MAQAPRGEVPDGRGRCAEVLGLGQVRQAERIQREEGHGAAPQMNGVQALPRFPGSWALGKALEIHRSSRPETQPFLMGLPIPAGTCLEGKWCNPLENQSSPGATVWSVLKYLCGVPCLMIP